MENVQLEKSGFQIFNGGASSVENGAEWKLSLEP